MAVNILDFNGDNTGTNDNVTALQLAHDALPSTGGTIVIPTDESGSTYNFGGQVNFTKTVNIDFGGAKIKVTHPTNNIFNISGSNARNSSIRGFEIGSTVARIGGYYFIATSQNVEVTQFFAQDYWRFIYIDDANSVRITKGEGYNPVAESSVGGAGFAVVGVGQPCGGITFSDLFFTSLTQEGSSGFGLLLCKNDVVHVNKCSFIRHGDAIRIAPDGSGNFCNIVLIDGCNFDTSSNALKVQPTNGASVNVLRLTDTWASVQAEAGVILNGMNGNISNTTLSGNMITGNTYGVITHGSVNNLNINSGDIIGNTYGVKINSGTSGFLNTSTVVTSNGTNIVNDSGGSFVVR